MPKATRSRAAVAMIGSVLLLAACTSGGGTATDAPSGSGASAASGSATVATAPPRPVGHETLWLCAPGMADNPCEGDLDLTTIDADGDRTETDFVPAADPVADCFYVYPTVSEAKGDSAPLKATDAEVFAARAQAARFAQSCRLFVPVYRQITRAGLASGAITDAKARKRAYDDVLSAFNDYLNTENQGRPFVLIGHSQGALNLTQLIQQEIDGNPLLRERMLSAILLGTTITTAPGEPDGGTFLNVPACESAEQSGCVVTYGSYAGTPPETGLFGRSSADHPALCVSPTQLLGRGDDLSAYLPTAALTGAEPVVADPPDTGFVTVPGAITGGCRTSKTFSWLDVDIDTKGLDLPELTGQSSASWGLHRADVNLTLGDLVDLVAAQSAAWTARGGRASEVG